MLPSFARYLKSANVECSRHRSSNEELECCRWELVAGSIQRPVIRRMDKAVVFTRIIPEQPETSMIVRFRPGWEELRAVILGLQLDKCAIQQLQS